MIQLRFANGYANMGDAKLLEKGFFVYQQVSTHTSVFATPTPSMTVLKEALDNYKSAAQAASTGDRVLIEQKNVAKQLVIDLLHRLGHYVLMTANGDRLVAVQSGFTLVKPSEPIVTTKPTDLKIEATNQPGQFQVSVKKVRGARAYMHQYTTDPLLKEESWMSMACTASKCLLTGLMPGTVYFIRVAAVGGNEQVMYSDVVSKMAA